MLAVNFRVELELRAQFRDELRVGVKNEIHVMPGIQFARDIRELTFVHLLDLLDLRAFFLKFGLETVDDILDCIIPALGVEDAS